MHIVLSAVEDALAEAWELWRGHLPGVTVVRGSTLDLDVAAVVSPANSFGFMDGGIDALYTSFFGRRVQDELQHRIRERHHGGLLVGAAEVVETRAPKMASAPTPVRGRWRWRSRRSCSA